MYKREYCEEIIRYGAQGKSFREFAKSLNIHRITLYKWARKHPEFKEAVEKTKIEYH